MRLFPSFFLSAESQTFKSKLQMVHAVGSMNSIRLPAHPRAYLSVQVDFEFQDPKEIDFHGLKALLGNYLDGAEFSSSELCDAIIKQSTVGTVIKTQGAGDELDPIAVMTVMNLHQKKATAFIKEISAFLKKKCPKDLKDQLSAVLAEKSVGLIINERVINIPQVSPCLPHFSALVHLGRALDNNSVLNTLTTTTHLIKSFHSCGGIGLCIKETAPPLVDGLFDEIEWATEDEPTEELQESFKFKKYIMLTRIFEDVDQEVSELCLVNKCVSNDEALC